MAAASSGGARSRSTASAVAAYLSTLPPDATFVAVSDGTLPARRTAAFSLAAHQASLAARLSAPAASRLHRRVTSARSKFRGRARGG